MLVAIMVATVVILSASGVGGESVEYKLEVAQEEVADLPQGAEVMILGERAGKVESIDYVDNNSDRVIITLSIDSEHQDEIFADSVVVPQRKFGVGAQTLVIRRPANGEVEKQRLEPGSTLKTFIGESDRIDQIAREVHSVSDSIAKIQQRFDPAMKNMTNTSANFNRSLLESINPAARSVTNTSEAIRPKSTDALKSVQDASDSFKVTNDTVRPETLETLQRIQAATILFEQRVDSLTKQLAALVENDVRDTLSGVRDASDKTSSAATTLDTSTKEVNESIQQTLTELQSATEEIRLLAEESREVVRIVRDEAEELPGTVTNINNTVGDTQDMVGEIRSHWLLRRYSKRAVPTEQVSPSGVRGGSAR